MLVQWQVQAVAPREAANPPLPTFERREEVTITRFGTYTRVILTKRAAPATPAGR
jgi:hypothetical protein